MAEPALCALFRDVSISLGSFPCRRGELLLQRVVSAFLPLPLPDSRDCILEPLSLPESPGAACSSEGSPSVPCVSCEERFPVAQQDQLLKHMIIEHKLVIADVKLVADFPR